MTMRAAVEMLTPTEAAMVSAVPLRTVHRMVDEHILPESLISRKAGRRVAVDACVYISFFENTADLLTRKARKRTIRHAVETSHPWHLAPDATTPDEAWIMWQDGIGVDFTGFAKGAHERYRLLDAARHAVVSDPDILGGTHVIRGTRVPAYAVAGAVAAGASVAEILEDYPSIDEETVGLAIVYANANPQQGRPKSIAERLPGLKPVETRTFPRPARDL